MKFVDEFRNPQLARQLLNQIRDLSGDRHLRIMEVCGGHTHTIYRHGLQQVLPSNIGLVHGPGCPVCVLPMGRIDDAIYLARTPGLIMTTYGDVMRVPGSQGSLIDAQAAGADVRIVYSPLDALRVAERHPDRHVVFLAIGFETTAPATALTILQAHRRGLDNFSVFCNHVTIVPALYAILQSPGMLLDGFIGPGHVSSVIGQQPYRFVAERFGRPLVTAGFEPLDLLQAIYMIVRQIAQGRAEVENQYTRVVQDEGNAAGLDAMAATMQLRPFFEWRGLGVINHSGLAIRDAFSRFDVERRFSLPGLRIADPKSCQCGEVLKGAIKPWQCKVFGTACTPETPIGTCMVSSEGACAAYYQYGRYHRPTIELQEAPA